MPYAVFTTGGKQYRVSKGDIIDIEKIDAEIGASATFDGVLLVSDGKVARLGDPLVTGGKVVAKVLEQRRAPKVIAFKYKRRTGFHKTKGHRRELTRLSIESIAG